MKKIIIFIALLFFLPFVTTVWAQEAGKTLPTTISGTEVTPTATPSPTPAQYLLPYPGLLPNSPLYKLKTLRDKIVSLLISDPLKKAQFDILQSDKRLNGAWYLLQQQPEQSTLVVQTVSKGENYTADAISQLQLAKKQGIGITDTAKQLSLSNAKHLDVVKQMEKSMKNSQEIGALQNEEIRIRGFGNVVNSTMLQQ